MLCRFLVVTTLFATLVQSQECTLDCPVGETCYTDAATALDCLYSIPMNEEWADQTIDVLSSSLENFGFGALYHSTGPPYVINLDIQGELSVTRTMVADKTFATDIEFQEHLQALFQSTLDGTFSVCQTFFSFSVLSFFLDKFSLVYSIQSCLFLVCSSHSLPKARVL